jgi:prevent-host-death family protein
MKSSIQAAKTQLPQLLKAASSGEEVVITKNGTPVARLVPIDADPMTRFIEAPPDLYKPMSSAELARWEGEA